MSLQRAAVAQVLFPLQERLKGHNTLAVHRELERSQWLDPTQLRVLQVERLRRFLSVIGAHVPYYEDLFRARGFDPQFITGIDALQSLPLLDKPTIRANTEALKARNAEGLRRFNTGGSTGEPLIFYLGNERISHDVAAKRRATRWWGVDIGDRETVVWGSPIELGAQDRARRLRDRLFRSDLLSAFDMSEANLARFVERIRAHKPRMLFGYPSSLAMIAEYAHSAGRRLDDLGIQVAFVTSERLYNHQRERITSGFGCPVANGYGGRDAGFIAHECPDGRLHVTSEDMVIEIVDEEGNVLPVGQTGEIVVTHLFTSAFPFVRYRTGDIGRLQESPCTCGRGLQVLDEIVGRSNDYVIATNGTAMHGASMTYLVRDIAGVNSFRIVQETLHHVHVQLVTDGSQDSQIEQRIAGHFRQRLGESVNVTFEYLSEIPREPSGKFRYVVSKVSRGQAA